MDDLDKRILSLIQTDFPVTPRPYDDLAERFDAGASDVIARVSAMRESGSIRRLGAVFDSRRLGYWSTLVAARLPEERLEEVAATVSLLAGVTHNYRRRHAYNLWFTLTAQSNNASRRSSPTSAGARASTRFSPCPPWSSTRSA